MKSALNGIRVIDLTTSYSGPIATMQLADFGAEVIKVENYKYGDPSRSWNPMINGRSIFYPVMNRNKKSITLNLKSEEGREILLELVKDADVVVENFRPGTMEKLRLTYDDFKSVNESIIMASISGYGQTGPYRLRPAYSNLAEALSGVMYLTGFPNGKPTGSGVSLGDSIGGLFLALGIMFALYYREKTGEGQYIDVSMTDAMLHMIENAVVGYSVTGQEPERIGNRDMAAYPYDLFEAKDGYCILSISDVNNWAPFADAVGLQHLINDPRFDTNQHRKQNEDALGQLIEAWTKTKTRAEIEAIFQEKKQGYSAVLKTSEVIENEQILAREMIIDMEDSAFGKYKMQGVPVKMSVTPGQIKSSAPDLGADNEEVLSRIGISKERIRELKEKGIL